MSEVEIYPNNTSISGEASDGSFDNITVSDDGKLKVDDDRYTHLLTLLLTEQRKTNQLLLHIAGQPLIDDEQEL